MTLNGTGFLVLLSVLFAFCLFLASWRLVDVWLAVIVGTCVILVFQRLFRSSGPSDLTDRNALFLVLHIINQDLLPSHLFQPTPRSQCSRVSLPASSSAPPPAPTPTSPTGKLGTREHSASDVGNHRLLLFLFYLYFYPKAPLQAGRRSFAKSLVLRLVKEFISSLKKAAALWLLAGQKVPYRHHRIHS